MKKYIPFISFVFISLLLTYIFSYRLKGNEFLYSGDQLFRFTYNETFNNSFFLRKLDDFGVSNAYHFVNEFWDQLFYLLVHSLGMSLQVIQKIQFFITFFVTLTISFFGFKKIFKFLFESIEILPLYIVTLWYVFNPYTISLWHGGVFNLGLAIFYALTPLIYYYFQITLFAPLTIRNVFILAIILFIGSFTFWLFAALLFFLVIYVSAYFVLDFTAFNIRRFAKNTVYLLSIYLPLASFILFNIFYEFTHNAGDNNATFSPSFGNELGGVWYQLLMLFSWGIYNIWYPRTMYSFHAYYFSLPYICSTVSIYLLIIVGLKKIYFEQIKGYIAQSFNEHKLLKYKLSRTSLILTIFIIEFFLCIFFAKAAQPPGGEIFLFFYNHVPFFSVFRTADIRFGFPIIFSLSILLLAASQRINKYFFFFFLGILLLVQNFLFFNGTVLYGENVKDKFYDRISYLPRSYQEVIHYFNSQPNSSSYILPIPAIEYGEYILDKDKHLFGQDMLSKYIDQRFAFLSATNGTYAKTYNNLNSILQKKDYKKLEMYPIEYILVRKDAVCSTCYLPKKVDMGKNFSLVFHNEQFDIYHIARHAPLVQSFNSSFYVVNPTEIHIKFSHIKNKQELALLLSFNNDWQLHLNKINSSFFCKQKVYIINSDSVECNSLNRYEWGSSMMSIFTPIVFKNTHKLYENYANKWEIDPGYIKSNFSSQYYHVYADGSIDLELTLYYESSSWFTKTLFLSLGIFSCIIFYLVFDTIKSLRKKV